jgi:parvulin-like peptidyl-prolyl isomerase
MTGMHNKPGFAPLGSLRRAKRRCAQAIMICAIAWGVGACESFHAEAPVVRDHMAAAGNEPPGNTASRAPNEDPASTNGDAAPPAGPPIAIVNDQPVDRREWIRLLVETHGLPLLQQMILLEVAEQESARRTLDVSEADVRHEYDLTIEADRFNGRDKESLTAARREQLIEDWTRNSGISRQELALAMRRQAHLRKIAEKLVVIDEAVLKEEYHRVHDEKVEVRHIQLAAPRIWAQVKERLDKGEPFESLVRQFSQNPISREKDGLLPPFSRRDSTWPPTFVEVAFQLQPGQVSDPFEDLGRVHVLKLVRRVPASGRRFEDVRDALAGPVTARLVAEKMESLGRDLLLRAKLQIADPILRQQYEQRRKREEIVGPPVADRP